MTTPDPPRVLPQLPLAPCPECGRVGVIVRLNAATVQARCPFCTLNALTVTGANAVQAAKVWNTAVASLTRPKGGQPMK